MMSFQVQLGVGGPHVLFRSQIEGCVVRGDRGYSVKHHADLEDTRCGLVN